MTFGINGGFVSPTPDDASTRERVRTKQNCRGRSRDYPEGHGRSSEYIPRGCGGLGPCQDSVDRSGVPTATGGPMRRAIG